ncbi:MAG: nuclease, partial [Bryobacterales bacterium]|nr:nuclease [Bryobacterales bacterium]
MNKLNADASAAGQGSPNYTFCGGVTNDVGLIAPAAIYRQDRVTSLECSQYGILTTYSTPGGGTSLLNDRPPVVFRANVKGAGSDSGLEVRVIVNHLRSLNGIDEPGAANGDRVRTKRNEQARYLANLVSGHLASEQSANWSLTDNLLVAGDMNAFDVNDGYSDSVNCIAGSPAFASQIYTTAAQMAVSSPCTAVSNLSLVNLTTTEVAERYSYSFAGIAQRIDHVLVNSSLNGRVRQFVYARNNADFPEGPAYRNDFNRP